MTRARLGTILLCVAGALAFGTYLAWSFGTRSEEKAQQIEDIVAEYTGEPAADITPNRTPAYAVAGVTLATLAAGLVLRKPRPRPQTELPTTFWGRPPDDP